MEDTISSTIQKITSIIEESNKVIKKQLADLKRVEKDVRSLENQLRKINRKKKQQSGTKKASGFAKPVNISNELSDFIKNNFREVLGVEIKDEEGDSEKVREKKEKERSENRQLIELIDNFDKKDPLEPFNKMARTNVTRLLTRYIKFHGIQDTVPKKRANILIFASPKGKLLGTLFRGVSKATNPDDLTFIKMQKYISHHFNPESPEPSLKRKVTTTKRLVRKPVAAQKA